MTPFMSQVAGVLAGAAPAPTDTLVRASAPRSIGHGAHEMVEVRSLAEQLVSEANPVLAGTGRELSLEDETGADRLVFTLRSGRAWARVVTSFEQRRSWGQLVTPDSVGAPQELVGVEALPGLILALITGSGGRRPAAAAAADRLLAAAVTREPCEPVRDLVAADDDRLAYEIQSMVSAHRKAAGARVVGHKIGLTSPAVQRQLGVDRPDFGLLFDDMQVAPGEPIAMTRVLQPKIEAEIAFVLAADLDDPDASAESVRGAVAHAVAALEIVDSRIRDWNITYVDTVADNASSGLFTLADRRVGLEAFEPSAVTMSMSINGQEVSTGSGADCLGDPLNALAWLARTAVAVGDPLRAGDIVLSGALGPMRAVSAGDVVEAEISGLGRVTATFAQEERQ